MTFTIEERASDAPLVQTFWRTQSELTQEFTSVAVSRWELVITRQQGTTTVGIRGPETRATRAPIPRNAEFFGISFAYGAFMPNHAPESLVDGGVLLPTASKRSFWLDGRAWEIPTFENADIFVSRLVRHGIVVRDHLVAETLAGRTDSKLSERTLRRRCLQATGLTPGLIRQIDRARYATTLLQRRVSILDTVAEAGYFDQAHLTRSLRRFIGHTPAQILQMGSAAEMSVSYKTREFAGR
jgi:AraC-like DNA-binding protein